MPYDSEHEFSDFISEVENVISALTDKLKSAHLQPDDKDALIDLCKKVRNMIPYQYSDMKTQYVFKQYANDVSAFLDNLKKLMSYLKIVNSLTSANLENTSKKLYIHWKKLAEEGNEEARVAYESMKREFPVIAKQIEDNIEVNNTDNHENLN